MLTDADRQWIADKNAEAWRLHDLQSALEEAERIIRQEQERAAELRRQIAALTGDA